MGPDLAHSGGFLGVSRPDLDHFGSFPEDLAHFGSVWGVSGPDLTHFGSFLGVPGRASFGPLWLRFWDTGHDWARFCSFSGVIKYDIAHFGCFGRSRA